jgi:hypothetical protein
LNYINTGFATRYNSSNGRHIWFNAPSGTAGNPISFTQAMTLGSDGNLLVGTTTTKNKLTVVSGAGSNPPALGTNGGVTYVGGDGVLYGLLTGVSTSGYAWMQAQRVDGTATAYDIVMQSAGGNLLVGTTTSRGKITVRADTNSSATPTVYFSNDGGTGVFASFGDSSGTVIGTIARSGSSTNYNTSSDYRLKNTIAPMTGALAKVAQLKPVTYKWNADGSDGEGFIAHELAEVVPQCVTCAKDAIDEEGNPQYQGIDTSFLVATLTAAIQEQQAMIESLRQRLSAANL